MLYGDRKQNDLLMFPTEGMTFSEESEKTVKSPFPFFHPFNVGTFMAGYKKRQGKVTHGNSNSLWGLIRKE